MTSKNSASALLVLLSAAGEQQNNTSRSNNPSLDQEIERLNKNLNGFNFKELNAFETIELMGIFTKAVSMIHELNIFFDKAKKSHAINMEGISHED